MSEIKGQLLGVVLVVAIFSLVSGVLLMAFKNASKIAYEKVGTEEIITPTNPDQTVNVGNLTF